LAGDIDVIPPVGRVEPKLFAEVFHRWITTEDTETTEVKAMCRIHTSVSSVSSVLTLTRGDQAELDALDAVEDVLGGSELRLGRICGTQDLVREAREVAGLQTSGVYSIRSAKSGFECGALKLHREVEEIGGLSALWQPSRIVLLVTAPLSVICSIMAGSGWCAAARRTAS
jgi:hypothetical protein